MTETKISLSFRVPGARLLSSQECDKNPKENYNYEKVTIKVTKGKGKDKKIINKAYTYRTRKQELVTQHINIGKETYDYMLNTPATEKLAKAIKVRKGVVVKRVWDTLSIHERLKHYFDSIAHDLRAVSYSYEILDD